MLDFGNGMAFNVLKGDELEKLVSMGAWAQPNSWEVICVEQRPPRVSEFSIKERCSKCKISGEGAMIHVGRKLYKRTNGRNFASIVNLCIHCGLELSKDPNETICYYLNGLLRDKDRLETAGFDWKIATSRKCYWANQDGYGFMAGPIEPDASKYWIRNNDGFSIQKFPTLESAKRTLLAPSIVATELFIEKFKAQYKKTIGKMSDQESMYSKIHKQ